MPDKKAIADRFFDLHIPLNQKELAVKYGISQPAVNQWKSGKKPIPLGKLFQAADEFGVTLDWLLAGREPKYRERESVDPTPC